MVAIVGIRSLVQHSLVDGVAHRKALGFSYAGGDLGSAPMCDYSLHHLKTRPARIGDKLTAQYFGTGTVGFAAPEDEASQFAFHQERSCLLQAKFDACPARWVGMRE